MSLNGISTETAGTPDATKLKRRADKLALAAAKRANVSLPGYRTLHTISSNHSAYVNGNLTSNISGTSSPTVGHPWS